MTSATSTCDPPPLTRLMDSLMVCRSQAISTIRNGVSGTVIGVSVAAIEHEPADRQPACFRVVNFDSSVNNTSARALARSTAGVHSDVIEVTRPLRTLTAPTESS